MYKSIIDMIIMEQAFLDEVPVETASLKDDLGIDSLKVVELIVELEDAYKIIFDESDLDPERLITVGDIYKLVEAYALGKK